MNFSLIKGKLTKKDILNLSPLVLAFVGDSIYEVFVRTYLVEENTEMSVHKLHVRTIEFVKAHAQSEFIKKIQSELTEEELYIFKRGRNAKSGTVPKNADVREYRLATGFETLVGFLYLMEEEERLNYLMNRVVDLKISEGKNETKS
ncbi:Mini-ribonuclease 3 [Clostridium fermenticellae]|uniref:Mini-ribonuclease 3 n=1 Tax=Clostridium fermenticellae TaxID=2068654 RepID=A0A386H0Z8_9CLOT|nr:ribonuclease III domain-containing protein [Clostridium fermenticellae]AYD39233.1 Mini-ribonuclease 3 [Clostridium fermenticellae]